MHIIHSFPPCMRTLQTILIQSTPPSSKATWDLDTLKKDIDADELHVCTTGESLGTKLDSIHDPKALTTEENKSKGKRKDPNDLNWLACQTCWKCGKTGHLHQKCMAMKEEKDTYRERKAAEQEGAAANMVTDEAEDKAMVTKMTSGLVLAAETQDRLSKRWIIDSGSTSHLCPNKSEFISYRKYNSPHHIQVGDARATPSLGEGTVSVMCVVDGRPVPHHIHNVQYIPNLTYGLLSCTVLNQRGLGTNFKDGVCRIRNKWECLIVESVKAEGPLYFLHTKGSPVAIVSADSDTALIIPPSFDLVDKQLAHPGKDTLQQRIRKGLVNGFTSTPDA